LIKYFFGKLTALESPLQREQTEIWYNLSKTQGNYRFSSGIEI